MEKRMLLIVDDEEDLAKTVAFRLKAMGYQVLVAHDGPSAFETIQANGKPDLILLDIMMPGMDGFEVLSKIKHNPETNSTPIIMFTAKGDTKAILKSQELGATDYVIKPFELDHLMGLIKKHI